MSCKLVEDRAKRIPQPKRKIPIFSIHARWYNGSATAAVIVAGQRLNSNIQFCCNLYESDDACWKHIGGKSHNVVLAYFLLSLSLEVRLESTWYCGHCLAYCTSPRWQMIVEQSVECELAGETEVLGENLPEFHFVHHKSHMTWTGLELGQPQWEAGD
jgi:hypothetical protein